MVIPRERLHAINAIQMRDLPTTRPTSTATAPATAPATLPPKAEVRMTIEEARRFALENNLDLKVDLLNPQIAAAALAGERAFYEAAFTTDLRYVKSDSPGAELDLDDEPDFGQRESLLVDPGIEIPLRTGGTIRVDAPLQRSDFGGATNGDNTQYTAEPGITISQPLLRGAGVAANALAIRTAFYQTQQAQARTKLEVIRVLASTDRAYWRLSAARQELAVRKQEYDLALAQLDRAKRQVAVGLAAEVEVLRAESGVADTLQSIIVADNALRDRERELKRIVNTQGLELGSPTVLIPATDPTPAPYHLDADALARAAVETRMEILETELQIASDTATVRAAQNDLLPLVSLDYTYNLNGLGDTPRDAYDMAGDADYANHTFGLRVQVPIGNGQARSRLRRAMLQRLQTLSTKQQRALQIRQEVYNAVDQLEASWQSILAARQRVALAARVLDVETRQFEQGLRTSTDVLDAQIRLADARSSEVAAVAEYQIAQVDIAFATGTVLGTSRVVLERPEKK